MTPAHSQDDPASQGDDATVERAPGEPNESEAVEAALEAEFAVEAPATFESDHHVETADHGLGADATLTNDQIATKVSRGGIWTVLGSFVVQSTLLVQALVLPKLLTPSDYGVWALALSIAFIGLQLRDLSLGLKFVQDRERSRDQAFNVAFTLEVMLGTGGFVVIALAAPVLGWAYGNSQLAWVTLGLAPFAFAGVLTLPEYVLTRDMRYASKTVRAVATSAVVIVVTLGAALTGWGVWSLVFGLWANMLMLAVTLWPLVRVRPRFVRDRPAFRSYLRFGWPLWAASLCLAGFNFVIVQTIAPLFGLVVAGYFQRVWSIVQTSYMINVQITAMLYPAICRLGDDIALLRRTFKMLNRLMMSVSAPLGLALVFFGRDLVLVWGPAWTGFGPMLQTLGVFFVFGTLAFDWEDYYRAKGETKPLFLISAYLLLFLPVFLGFMFLFGQAGINLGIVVTAVYLYLIRSHFARKLLGPVSALAAAWRQIAASVLCGAAAFGVRTYFAGGSLGADLTAGLIGVTVMAVLYCLVMLATERRLGVFLLDALRSRPTGGLRALIGD